MRRVLFLLFAICVIGAAAGCSGTSVHACEVPGCTSDGVYMHLGEDGEEHFYCDFHYKYIVPMDEQLNASPAPSSDKDLSLCELCDKEGLLTYTDENGLEHLLCSDHYAVVVRLEKEAAASTTAPSVCEVCGKPAVLSTRTDNGEEHFYCTEHYSEMLGMLD